MMGWLISIAFLIGWMVTREIMFAFIAGLFSIAGSIGFGIASLRIDTRKLVELLQKKD